MKAIRCPKCGSDSFEYREEGWTDQEVLLDEEGNIVYGEILMGENTESYFTCQNCGNKETDSEAIVVDVEE